MSAPQTYLGELEERCTEMQATGLDLAAADPEEFADLRFLHSTLERIGEMAIEADVRRHLAAARMRAHRLLVRDIAENKRHRRVAAGAR